MMRFLFGVLDWYVVHIVKVWALQATYLNVRAHCDEIITIAALYDEQFPRVTLGKSSSFTALSVLFRVGWMDDIFFRRLRVRCAIVTVAVHRCNYHNSYFCEKETSSVL